MSKKRTLEVAQFVDDMSNEFSQAVKKARENQKTVASECIKDLLEVADKLETVSNKLHGTHHFDNSVVTKIRSGLGEHFPQVKLPATVVARNRRELGYLYTYSGMTPEKLAEEKQKHGAADAVKIEKFRKAQQELNDAKTKIVESVAKDDYDKEFDDCHKLVGDLRTRLSAISSNMRLYKISSPKDLIN